MFIYLFHLFTTHPSPFSPPQEIHAANIVSVGRHSIRCSKAIRENVHAQLVPPYEELFDEAEEHALTVLFDAWSDMLEFDLSTFDKVCELKDEIRCMCLP